MPSPMKLRIPVAISLTLLTCPASAGTFDPQGNWDFEPNAVFQEGFESFPSWDPNDPAPGAIEDLYVLSDPDALEGAFVGIVQAQSWWGGVSLPVSLPPSPGAYRARLWIRAGSLNAVFVASYLTKPSKQVLADLSETGRCTSDGWVEMTSAPFSIDGADVGGAMLYLRGYALIDGVEFVPEGEFVDDVACQGAFDPACGSLGPCIDEVCRAGDALVPHLPPPAERDRVVDFLRTRLQYFFGGHKTRRDHLPDAIEELEKMRKATTPWTFWHGFATAVRKLHDWHTAASGPISYFRSSHQLNVCFIEGDADLSHAQSPPDERYLDLLVSHTGADRTAGLRAGDRLVAVDGVHPIAWARSLIDVSWDWWQASDDSVNAEFAERLRSLIPKYARTFTVIRCDASTSSCDGSPEVIDVRTLHAVSEEDGDLVSCDNRPGYHLVDGPDPETHWVGYDVYAGLLKDSEPGENLYGMTWDTLWGPSFTSVFRANNEMFKQSARGVILDHRAGNGGTIDAPEAITELVRAPFDIAIFIYQRPWADYEGPGTPEEGLDIFDRYKGYSGYQDLTYSVGSSNAKLDLPVALLLHRDGSASDYLPFGMKGAPKVRIFGPQPTAGAFSSYVQFSVGGSLTVQMASGDTIAYDGQALIGNGAEPDEIVLPLQSDLIHGKDTLYLRALEWVRSELAP